MSKLSPFLVSLSVQIFRMEGNGSKSYAGTINLPPAGASCRVFPGALQIASFLYTVVSETGEFLKNLS